MSEVSFDYNNAIERLSAKEAEAYESLNSFEKEYDEWLISKLEWEKEGEMSLDLCGSGINTPIW